MSNSEEGEKKNLGKSGAPCCVNVEISYGWEHAP